MRKIKITVKRMACYADLMAEYENPIEHACDMTLGQVFMPMDGNGQRGSVRVLGSRFHRL